jgi:MoaA/NifB/PqqE/SkfB family radical SAM enzyme
MKALQLAKLATKHIASAAAETAYLKFGIDKTRPVAIYAMVTHRCNSKCLYCDFWRRDAKEELAKEMTIEQWQNAFLSLKEFIGHYSVELSGGEPFCKKDFIKIPEFLHANKIIWGLTTNGLYINEDRAQRLVASKAFNINMSIDSTDAAMHDYLRGYNGALAKTTEAIRLLQKERDAQKIMFPIIIKPTMTVRNMAMMPDMVRFARDMGVVCNIQPLNRWTPETYTNDLWIGPEKMKEVEAITEELLKMKAEGYPLLTHERVLKLFPDHFMDKRAPKEAMPCRVGMRNFFINPNGDVRMCFFFRPVGNLATQTAKEIWYGEEARAVRKETVECEELCLFTCLSQKTITDKVRMGLKLLTQRQAVARPREEMANRQPTAFRTDSGAKGVSLPVLTTGAEFQNDHSHGASHTAMGEAAVVEAGLADAAAMSGNDSMN